MQLRNITDKTQWDNFIARQKPDTFLHSWSWGEFNKALGNKIYRVGIFDFSEKMDAASEMIGAVLIIVISAKRGKFLFCPHGPIIKKSQISNPNDQSNLKLQIPKIFNALFIYLKDLAREEKVDFIRISPIFKKTPENLALFRSCGFRGAPVHMMHPELSWLLDISGDDDAILKGMRKTSRNLVRRADRDGVKVVESKNIIDIEKFYALHNETVGRHGFVPFSLDYLKKEFEMLGKQNEISIFFAIHENIILASAIIVFNGQSAFYHHGASSSSSKVPAAYGLMWKIFKISKGRGCKIFNFWGIAPEDQPKHPWAGLTLFKKGFGGYAEEYMHVQDYPLTFKYWVNYIIETIRRIKRGY